MSFAVDGLKNIREMSGVVATSALIEAGGCGLVTTLALARLSPSCAARYGKALLSPLSRCQTRLADRVRRIENFANSAKDKRDLVGSVVAIKALTAKGLFDHADSRVTEQEQKDRDRVIDERFAKLSAQLVDMQNMNVTLSKQLDTEIQKRQELELKIEKLKTQAPESNMDSVKKRLFF